MLKLEKQDQHNGENMQQLIEPDGTYDLVTGFQGIDEKVSAEENSDRQQGWVCKQGENSRVGSAVIEIYFPTLPFLHAHPGALKGEVPHKMAGQPDEQCLNGDTQYHRPSPFIVLFLKCSRAWGKPL